MELQLKNIGMIKEANVKIDGLTVIAGENDTGKSTVGKVIFCIIKATSRYKEDFNESKIFKIKEKLDRLFFYVRRNINITDEVTEKYYEELKNILSMDYYIENNHNPKKYLESLHNRLFPLKIAIKEYDNSSVSHTEKILNELAFIINTPEDKNKSIENALNKVFRSEFDSNILSFGEDVGFIKLVENTLTLLELKIENNKIEIISDCEPIEFNEITFIETPLILNNHDMLIRSQTGLDTTRRSSRRLGIPYTTLHTKDLFDKLKSNEFIFIDDFEINLKSEISEIIQGEIVYDVDERDFVYIKDNNKIPIKNTATGIKAFGIIQLLIDAGFISKSSVLVLDEPEIHIHPKWQLKYAQLISVLVDNGVPIIVTSHSPYMIQALIKYARDKDIVDRSNFYLTRKNEDNVDIDNVNDELNEIFELLAKPMNEVFEL